MKTLIMLSILLTGCASWTPEQRHRAEAIAVTIAATSVALSVAASEKQHQCDDWGCRNLSHGIGPQVRP